MKLSRPVIIGAPIAAAVVVAVVVAALFSTAPVEQAETGPVPTQSAPTGGDPASIYPADAFLGAPLDLPTIDIDIEKMLTKDDGLSMQTGVLWLQGAPENVDDIFENDTQREVFKTISSCYPARESNPTPEQLYTATLECSERAAITAAATVKDPSDVFMALRGLSLARPDVFTLCHNASHKVGEIAFRRLYAARGTDYDGMFRLLQTGAIACQGGLVHGVYDAFGYMKPSLDEFEKAVSACERNAQIVGQCSDAVGHAAWDAYGTIDQALLACRSWDTDSYQQICAEGIVMRKFQRMEVNDPFYIGAVFGPEADRFIEQALSTCSEWTTSPVEGILRQDPRTLCIESSTYLLAKPLLALTQRNGGDYKAVEPEAKRLIGVIVDTCNEYGQDAKYCLGRLGWYLLGVTVYDLEATKQLCTSLPKEYVAECQSNATEKLANVERGIG
jgi:hypothetical protein